jgi:hypothetical protein
VFEAEVASAHSIFTAGDEGEVQLVIGAFGAEENKQKTFSR